jgi:hypothetical protein
METWFEHMRRYLDTNLYALAIARPRGSPSAGNDPR